MRTVTISWKSYKYSKRATVVSWLAGHSGYIMAVLCFCTFMGFGYLGIGILLSAVLALVSSTVVVFALCAGLERLSEKWAKKDTLKYYQEHPDEFVAMLKEAELQEKSTLKKFY